MSISQPQEPPGGWDRPVPLAAVATYGVKFSQKRAWGLSIITWGVWAVWWLHATRQRFDAELGDGRDDALKHTLLYFVPVANFFVVYWLWRDLSVLRQRVGLAGFPAGGYVVGAILLAPVFFTLALNRHNEYWDARFAGHAVDAPFTTGEKASVALGIVVFLLYMVLFALLIVTFVVLSSSN
jgi:hypothetical protein